MTGPLARVHYLVETDTDRTWYYRTAHAEATLTRIEKETRREYPQVRVERIRPAT